MKTSPVSIGLIFVGCVLMAVFFLGQPSPPVRVAAIPTTGPSAGVSESPLVQHEEWNRILMTYVQNGLVDYQALALERGSLDNYLARLGNLPAANFDDQSREDQLATLINLYNAATLQLILDHYPLKSIRNIGLLPHAAWRKEFVVWQGQAISLGHLEHEIIRTRYSEPRIHFALVCAAVSCPPLRSEAYVGERLNSQLSDQASRFLADETKNQFDATTRTARLSKIFEWYEEDFHVNGKGLADYLRGQLPEDHVFQNTASEWKLESLDYDWSLNQRL